VFVYKRVFLTTLLTFAVAAAASVGGPNSFDGKWALDKKAGNTATVPPTRRSSAEHQSEWQQHLHRFDVQGTAQRRGGERTLDAHPLR
jgi:hypothetical protein